MRALAAEALKLKRTLALRMVLLAPALVALLSLLAQSTAILTGRSDLTATLWHSHSHVYDSNEADVLREMGAFIETRAR